MSLFRRRETLWKHHDVGNDFTLISTGTSRRVSDNHHRDILILIETPTDNSVDDFVQAASWALRIPSVALAPDRKELGITGNEQMSDALPLTAFDIHRPGCVIVEASLEIDTLSPTLVSERKQTPLLCRL
jgi:hypothetical protein